ncbi:MAG: 5-oxoprolinase subunit PxpB [Actinomycetota bacterium]|nr:5-oxoprolinase subunit PxpB [Actinomycetota bacterium]
MQLLPCGPDALLVELGSLREVAAVRAGLARAALPQVVELVPAARTVLVAVRPGAGLDEVRATLEKIDPADIPERSGRTVTLPVHYDGPDLELVAETAGCRTDEVIALHSQPEYTVAFNGFAPGFSYLTGLTPQLQQPRLEQPREWVPAGAVGIAGEFTGAYPRPSPGGWRLVGGTDAELFDPRRDSPALLHPGDRVRIQVV